MIITSLTGRAILAAALMLWPAHAANASGPGDPQSKITQYLNADAPSARSPYGAATVTPDTLFFTHQVGRLYLLPPFQFAHLQSSDAPAAYVSEVEGPDSLFARLAEPKGITPDTAMVQIAPPDVPGTFVNTVLFHVQGVAEPTRLVVHLDVLDHDSGNASAWVVPNMLYFQAQAGVEVLLSQNVLLRSEPGSLTYTGSVLPGGGGLTALAPSTGITPGSVTVLVDPARAFSAGMYEDTIVFQVEGVPYPVPLFVMVYIVDSLPAPSPPRLVVDTVATVSGVDVEVCVRAAGTGSAWGGFDLLLDFPAALLNLQGVLPGEFPAGCGWEYFTYRSPAAGKVKVVAIADINDASHPSCLTPSPGAELACVTFRVADDSAPACKVAPVRFWWETCADNVITDQAGSQMTLVSTLPGSVRDYDGTDLTGSMGYGGPPEPCPDGFSILRTAQFQSGAVFIDCDSLPHPTDTAWAEPSTLYFTTVEGFAPTVMLSQWVHVFSSNAPASYVAGVSGPEPIFTYLADSLGQTDDYMEILVNPAGWSAGTYANTVRFYVNGVGQPAQVNVLLTVLPDSTGGGTDSATVVPSELTVQAPVGSTTPIQRWVMLYSSNAPALYFGYTVSLPGFAFVPDSVGYTPDSVRVLIDPSGLAIGTHRDTIVFEVQGITFPVQLSVTLLVTSGDSVAVRNYPNPFNPETQIAFALPEAARVSLIVYNVMGQHVLTLVDRELPAGEQRFTWDGRTGDGRQAASGVYFYRLSVQDRVYTGKMMMLR